MPITQTPQRVQLGRALRIWRERRGLSREAVADAIACAPARYAKIETGHATVGLLELRTMLALFEVPPGVETEKLSALADQARKRLNHRVPEWARAYVSLEAVAVEIDSFQIDLVPGLLQTKAYTRAVATAVDPGRSSDEVARLVDIRQERQERLTSSSPPALTAVVHECAIRTRVGGADVMRGQLQRLLQLGELPNVTLRVLPFRAGEHAAMGSAFTILRLPDPTEAEVVYLEDLWSADYVDGERQVAAYTGAFSRLVEVSLDEKDSAAMIEEATGELS